MISVETIMPSVRGIQTSLFIQKRTLIYVLKQLRDQKLHDVTKVKQMLKERLQERQRLYYNIYDIINKLQNDQTDVMSQEHPGDSEIFGLKAVSVVSQRPILVTPDMKLTVSSSQERIIYRMIKSMFYCQESFNYDLANLEQQRVDRSNVQYEMNQYEYINSLENDNYYDLTVLNQFLSRKIYVLSGIDAAAAHFAGLYNKFFVSNENINTKPGAKPAALGHWQNYLFKLYANANALREALSKMRPSGSTETDIDVEIQVRKCLNDIFFLQSQFPEVLTTMGLQFFHTFQCEAVKNHQLFGVKRYEHVCYTESNRNDYLSGKMEGNGKNDENQQSLQNNNELDTKNIEQPHKSTNPTYRAHRRIQKIDQESYIQERCYIVCCPGCCIPNSQLQHFEPAWHNREHARSYMSGKILLFEEKLEDKTQHGFYISEQQDNQSNYVGYITPFEHLNNWYNGNVQKKTKRD